VKFITIKLPKDRDLLFELSKYNTLIVSIYIVNYDMDRIIIRNNSDLLIIISRYTKLGRVVEYKVVNYF